VGVDFDGAPKTPIFPIFDGILEYSGFGAINGKYVMLSHPEIRTEDGFVLHSLYMHLRDLKVSFTAYQKMLREVSFNTYPQIPVLQDSQIGILGQTGNAKGYPHLHLQLEFRNEAGDIILVDPLRALGFSSQDNLTKDISTKKTYMKFLKDNEKEIKKTNLKDFIIAELGKRK
jgi:murein DD-endopeptidase MepM/ murein hydrolase activator NlpD